MTDVFEMDMAAAELAVLAHPDPAETLILEQQARVLLGNPAVDELYQAPAPHQRALTPRSALTYRANRRNRGRVEYRAGVLRRHQERVLNAAREHLGIQSRDLTQAQFAEIARLLRNANGYN